MDSRLRELCRAASMGDVAAAERLIFNAARAGWWVAPHESQTSYWDNKGRASLIRLLGYLRWRGAKDLVQAVSPAPPTSGWENAGRYTLKPYSSIGADLSQYLPVGVFGAAIGGVAARVSSLANASPRDVIEVARAAATSQNRWENAPFRPEDAAAAARAEAVRDEYDQAYAYLRDHPLGWAGGGFSHDPLIRSAHDMAAYAARECLLEWARGMNPRSHPSNRKRDLYGAAFYGDLALACECEDKKGTVLLESARMPHPRVRNRGWTPSRSCMTKGKREAREAMLQPTILATASFACTF